MARKISMVALFVVLAATLQQSTFAANYTVGDSAGWRVPPANNDDLYDNWTDNKRFVVGDILVFNFASGTHDVVEVTKADYAACATTNPLLNLTNGPATVTLNRTGDQYYICTFPGHCNSGQKLEVEVRSGNSTAPTPGSSPNTPTGVPTPPSSASSLVATLSLVFMSFILALSCYQC